mgnify:CR=1 FL=1
MSFMKIVVLCGGLSPERDVSLVSGRLIANSLIRQGNRVALVDLYLGIENPSEDLSALFGQEEITGQGVGETAPDLDSLRRPGDASLIGPRVLEICRI